jgi:hypothetical protein
MSAAQRRAIQLVRRVVVLLMHAIVSNGINASNTWLGLVAMRYFVGWLWRWAIPCCMACSGIANSWHAVDGGSVIR